MSFFEEFLDVMPDQVTLHLHSGWNQAGDEIEGDDLTVDCYVEGGAQRTVDANGVEVTSTARVYLATVTGINANTKVTLPEGHLPRERLPLINVMRMSDEEGPSHMVISV